MPSTPEVALALPPALRGKVEILSSGRDRDQQEVYWYYRFLEIGDHKRAAIDAGYPPDKAADVGRRLRYKLAPLVLEGVRHLGQTTLPLAVATLENVIRTYDPSKTMKVTRFLKDGVSEEREEPHPHASPAMATAAARAAEALMDRFGLPKGIEIKESLKDRSEDRDSRLLIDLMVQQFGVEAVRRIPDIANFREYRDHFEAKLAAGDYDQYRFRDVIDITPGAGGAEDDLGDAPGPEAAAPEPDLEPEFI